MARRDKSLLRLDAVRVEGALIQPDILAAAASCAAEGQSAASYGIERGLNLRDEIGRAYLIAKGLWVSFQEGRGGSSPDAVHRALANGVLTKVLGFEFPHRRRFASKTGGDLELMQAAGRVPVAIAGTEGIDHVEIVATSGSDPIRRSATTLVQGEVNSREGALWGMATNGLTWRILRDNESITRPGYIEIDLARIFRDDLYSDFSAFWLIAHRSRFPQEDAAGSDCVLERWRQIGRKQGVTAREDLRDGVQKALFHFGRGFLENPANKALVDRLNADGADAADERGVLPPALAAGLPADLRHDRGGPRNPASRWRRRRREGGLREWLHDRAPARALAQQHRLGPPPRRLRRHEGRFPGPAPRGAEARRCRRSAGCSPPSRRPISTAPNSPIGDSSGRSTTSPGCAATARSRASTGATWRPRSSARSTRACWN